MRFLFLTQYFPPEIGGPQTRLQSMAVELLRHGHEVEVVTALPNYPRGAFFPGYEGKFYVREVRQGIVIHRVWLYPAMGSGLARLLNYATFTITCIYGLLRARRPDLLLVESPPLTTSVPAFLAKLFWRAPFIFNVADLWPDAVLDTGFLKEGFLLRLILAFERWSYNRALFVNAVTDGIRDALLHKKGLPPEKVLFLPNGADTLHYQPRDPDLALKRALGLEDKRIILWAGTQGHFHGLENVLRAANVLRHRPDIHFLFLGDGSARPVLERMKRDLSLDNVTFRDPVSIEQLPPYYSISDCGLSSLLPLPSNEGARPSKIFPVLASGKPLLFVGSGECARLIQRANAGVVVAPENPDALALAIVRLFDQPSRLQEFGGNGRRFIEEHFDWSKLISRWVAQVRLPQSSV